MSQNLEFLQLSSSKENCRWFHLYWWQTVMSWSWSTLLSLYILVSCFCYNGANRFGTQYAEENSPSIFLLSSSNITLAFLCFCFRAEQTPSARHSLLLSPCFCIVRLVPHFCWNVPAISLVCQTSPSIAPSSHMLPSHCTLFLSPLSLSRSILIECKSRGQSLWTWGRAQSPI